MTDDFARFNQLAPYIMHTETKIQIRNKLSFPLKDIGYFGGGQKFVDSSAVIKKSFSLI